MTFFVSDERTDIREKRRLYIMAVLRIYIAVKIPLYISEVFSLSLKAKTPKLEHY